MNRRIQKKIAKRIINKIGTEQPLTDFERKYLIKFFWKPLRKEVTSIIEELKIEEELVKEKIEELSIAEETAVEQAEWFGGVDLGEGPDMTVHSVVKLGDGNLVVSGQLVSEDAFEKYFKDNGCSDEEFAGVVDNLFVEPTMEQKMQMAIDSMNNFGSQLNPEPLAPVEEPNRWNKLKGKVKGWFGK